MKTLLFFLFLNITSIGVFSQNINSFAFYKVTQPGIVKMDEENNEIPSKSLVQRFIYLECKQKPIVEKIFYHKKTVQGFVITNAQKEINVGLNKSNGKPIIIKATKKNAFYILRIAPSLIEENEYGKNINTINIIFKCNSIKYTITLNKEIELVNTLTK